MASRYNTRSTSAATPTQHRRFCIVLTNNPQMIQTARRMVHDLPRNVATEQGHSTQQQQSRQQQQQPEVQMQNLQASAQTRTRRRADEIQVEQQVPMSTSSEEAANVIPPNMRAYEKEIEEDFQAQVQPILQLYLQKTRRSSPINLVLDMSNYVQA